MVRRVENVMVRSIAVEDDTRLSLVESHVEALMESIGEVGLLEPIIVCRRTKRTPMVLLVAGRHRFEACKRLKHETIAALVESEDSPEIDRWRTLAEIDENLIRRDLTAAQRAKLVARRKAAYEAVHPEAKHGGAPAKKGGGKASRAKDAKSASFADDTATKTGRSKRAVAQDAARGEALRDDLDRVAGTSLDKGTELDALAKMSAEERAPLIEQAAAGENVSALHQTGEEPKAGYSDLMRTWKSFRAAWLRASPAGRSAFLGDVGDEFAAILADTSEMRAAS
ncbi:ParB N-terminal domain-containing protein [Bradyrhizobium japonicum]|uniref:ParB N-terminal domain-containing protein n=1 Tax=Bradyrhizobium japonicum TaxID=375 RepID=UPI001E28908E|nr:ParB N-terminal domain-containing protein [Bradyrhizobium japonicum]MCD9821161.1 ParB N-terminal domain-containing protein [Bradyrhizobium japonicum]MEB2674142.1 ParB N-terminal domain-containing protein [Bradyrhizobium japonicum]WRI93328.1 ParB N-terminal domain-containing protein [Bradyrhizobium japonicum]